MTESINLNIAGFNIGINFQPIDNVYMRETFIKAIKNDYAGFVTKNNDKVDFAINFIEAEDTEMIYREKQKSYYFETLRFKGNNSVETFYRVGPAQFTLIFKQLLLRILERKDAFMLHTSSVRIGKYAYLFMAHSGGGKSTTMKNLSYKYKSIADDSVIIRRENGKYYLYQTPMIEKEWWIKKNSQKYEIGALYFLKKALVYEERPFENKREMLVYLMDQLLISDRDNKKQAKLIMRFAKEFDRFKLLYLGKDREKLIQYFEKKQK
jgi:hypothetical protein